MAASGMKTKTINVVDLLLDTRNPRFVVQDNQREALQKMAVEQGQKLVKLAEHLAAQGLNPSELPIVTQHGEMGKYIVLEGNRRIAAIKLAKEPQLVKSLGLTKKLTTRFLDINTKHGDDLPLSIPCAVASSRDQAKIWVELRHTGEMGGIGIINWNGIATARFRGKPPESQLVEMVRASSFLDEDTRGNLDKIPITNIQRILGTPDARELLGIDVRGNDLRLSGDEQEVIGRLAIVVSDIVNKHIKVTQLDSKAQRVNYAHAVSQRPLPKPKTEIAPTTISSEPSTSRVQKTKRGTRTTRKRKTLIPRVLALNITQTRIADIFQELQGLHIDKFVNSCAVLLRVFLEMSLEEYTRKNSIPRFDTSKQPAKEFKLTQKIRNVADFMQKKGISTTGELHGIRTLAKSKGEVFSIDTWHHYVHNKDYKPDPGRLKNDWDNIQSFFEKLWA